MRLREESGPRAVRQGHLTRITGAIFTTPIRKEQRAAKVESLYPISSFNFLHWMILKILFAITLNDSTVMYIRVYFRKPFLDALHNVKIYQVLLLLYLLIGVVIILV